ncbi:MAG: hypothetical protein M0Z70_12120 [Nitrospiraceae bacterium]|jgi:hypothetical protein|nr:hypothetical protein [Nitrospiraceae bacterium]
MNPVGILENISRGMVAAQAIHGSATYFSNQVTKQKTPNRYTSSEEFTFTGPKIVKVGDPYVYSGSAPTGIIEIFSAGVLERSVVSFDGRYYATLYFSKPTAPEQYYEMYAVLHSPTLGKVRSSSIHVTALTCPSCHGK